MYDNVKEFLRFGGALTALVVALWIMLFVGGKILVRLVEHHW